MFINPLYAQLNILSSTNEKVFNKKYNEYITHAPATAQRREVTGQRLTGLN